MNKNNGSIRESGSNFISQGKTSYYHALPVAINHPKHRQAFYHSGRFDGCNQPPNTLLQQKFWGLSASRPYMMSQELQGGKGAFHC